MRLTTEQQRLIRAATREVFGPGATVRLFGSRLDDEARGGDIDLLVELSEPVNNPALSAAKLATKVSRAIHGRQVDVLVSAPNLRRLPIHEVAAREGVML